MAEVLRQDLKQQEKQQTDAKAFISIVKKYTDMKELDATILREFIDHIEVSHADRKSRTREITIVYNFIGAFDFSRAIEEATFPTQNSKKRHSRLIYTVPCFNVFLTQSPIRGSFYLYCFLHFPSSGKAKILPFCSFA